MSYLPANDRYDNKINYRRCGHSGLSLPEISLGLWHNFGGVDIPENGRTMLRFAFDQGITHFDLANNYGPPSWFCRRKLRCNSQKRFSSLQG